MNLFKNTPIWSVVQNAKKLSDDTIFVEVFSTSIVKRFTVKLNTDQLKEEGINSLGQKLSEVGGEYSPVTLFLSARKGRPKRSATHIDLYDTGEYHQSFRITNVTGRGFVIDSDPDKDDTNLLDEWGAEIEGLTFESLNKLADFVLNFYIDKVWQRLMKIG